MHLSAFSRGKVHTGHIAQGTRPSFQNLLGALGCSFMLSVALCGLCSCSGLTPLLPFTHCPCPLYWPFTLPPCPPSPFYESFIHLLWLLRVFVAFCSCCEPGCSIVVASLVAEHRLKAGRQAQGLPRSMWDLPGPGTEPMAPPLAGRFLTAASGKSVPPPSPAPFKLLYLFVIYR